MTTALEKADQPLKHFQLHIAEQDKKNLFAALLYCCSRVILCFLLEVCDVTKN